MRLFFFLLVTFGLTIASSSTLAKQSPEASEFGEYCSQLDETIRNSQVTWHCANRGYKSSRELYEGLRKRHPKLEWKKQWHWAGEPMLANLNANRFFWDCIPNKEDCGIWVEFSSGEFLFIQQLLDRSAGNEWLGVGLTVYCEGAQKTCIEFQKKMMNSVPDGDISETSMVGSPPPIPVQYKPTGR